MKAKSFFALDPYCDKHLILLTKFEEDTNIDHIFSNELLIIRQNYKQEDYLKKIQLENETTQHFCLCKDNQIVGLSTFYIQKDIKSCHITFAKTNNSTQTSKLISQATQYALDILGMEEVFSSTPSSDLSYTNFLLNIGYENLGTDEGLTYFVIEKSQLDTIRKKNNGNI